MVIIMEPLFEETQLDATAMPIVRIFCLNHVLPPHLNHRVFLPISIAKNMKFEKSGTYAIMAVAHPLFSGKWSVL